MADWFYGKDSTQHGPIPEEEIRNLLSSGQIDINTIIWREGMGNWIPLKDVPEFQGATGASTSSIDSTVAGGASPYSTPQTNSAQYQPHIPVAPTDGMSIAALVCGILAAITCYLGGLFGLPAVICGHMSLRKIKNSPTPLAGKGMAIAGLVTGYIGIAMSLFFVVFFAIGIAGGAMNP